MRILGIDLGTKSMGLAITDNTQTIVNGISNFEFTRNNYQQCIDEISKILKQYQNEIKQIVLGHPLTLKNTKSEWTLTVEKFANILKQKFNELEITLFDERFSTVNTIDFLKYDLGLKMSKVKKIKDKMSAVTILNDYLSTRKCEKR